MKSHCARPITDNCKIPSLTTTSIDFFLLYFHFVQFFFSFLHLTSSLSVDKIQLTTLTGEERETIKCSSIQRCFQHHSVDSNRRFLRTSDIGSWHSALCKSQQKFNIRIATEKFAGIRTHLAICGLKQRKSHAGHAAKFSLAMCCPLAMHMGSVALQWLHVSSIIGNS